MVTSAQVSAAIEAIVTGQASSYTIGNRSVTKLNLKELFELQRQLEAKEQRATRRVTLAKIRRAR